MHCVLLGVTKYFLNIWLQKSNRQTPFYIGNQVGSQSNCRTIGLVNFLTGTCRFPSLTEDCVVLKFLMSLKGLLVNSKKESIGKVHSLWSGA